MFVQRGLFVAVVDTPNQVAIDGNVRLSAQYAQDNAHVIADVRGRIDGGKVWLVGTSTGTMSAASIAARLPRIAPPTKDNLRRPDGIVLTATQTNVVKGFCGRTVFNAQLSAVNVPALVAHHLADDCKCSPPKFAAKVVAALTAAPGQGAHHVHRRRSADIQGSLHGEDAARFPRHRGQGGRGDRRLDQGSLSGEGNACATPGRAAP